MIFMIAAALAAAAPGPASCPSILTAEAQSCRAVEASSAGKFAEAAAAFESAADLTPASDPAHDRALAAAGNMWIAAGQPGKAAMALDKALAGKGLLAEKHGLALVDRARALGVEQQPPAPLRLGRHVVAMGVSPGPRVGEVLRRSFAGPIEEDVRVAAASRRELHSA